MTELEGKAIVAICNTLRNPIVSHSEWEFGKGGLGKVEINTVQEAKRLSESEDFRKGWEACHAQFRDHLAAVIEVVGKPKQLARMLRHWT